jgi:hypothetical protein
MSGVIQCGGQDGTTHTIGSLDKCLFDNLPAFGPSFVGQSFRHQLHFAHQFRLIPKTYEPLDSCRVTALGKTYWQPMNSMLIKIWDRHTRRFFGSLFQCLRRNASRRHHWSSLSQGRRNGLISSSVVILFFTTKMHLDYKRSHVFSCNMK